MNAFAAMVEPVRAPVWRGHSKRHTLVDDDWELPCEERERVNGILLSNLGSASRDKSCRYEMHVARSLAYQQPAKAAAVMLLPLFQVALMGVEAVWPQGVRHD